MKLSGVVSYPLCLKFFRHRPLKATMDRPRPAGSGRQSVLDRHCPLGREPREWRCHPANGYLFLDGFRTLQISGRFVNFRFRFRYRYRFRPLLPPVKLSAVLDLIRGQECPRSVLFIRCPAKPCSYASGFGAHVRGTWTFRVRMKYALGEKLRCRSPARQARGAPVQFTQHFHCDRVLVPVIDIDIEKWSNSPRPNGLDFSSEKWILYSCVYFGYLHW